MDIKIDHRNALTADGDGMRSANRDTVQKAEAAALCNRIVTVDACVVARWAHEAEGVRRRQARDGRRVGSVIRERSARGEHAVNGGNNSTGSAARGAHAAF